MKLKRQGFKFRPFSIKQKKVLTWWVSSSPYRDKDIIICDGAIRSGKTLIMSLSYVIWAMQAYNRINFGMAGKSIGSFKRNVWMLLKVMLRLRRYKVSKLPGMKDTFIIRKGEIENYFYIFGGRDESSQDLVQGFTAGGFFFDEVALMPESFVNQATARCSEEGAKIWFNCNPEGPYHWFKLEWIDKLVEKNAFRLHFLLDDNPSLSEKTKATYRRRYTGVFYQRFILGLWVLAEGIIYSMFTPKMVIDKVPDNIKIIKKWIGVDYGQSNATTFILVGLGSDRKLYILDEYYHSGRDSQVQKSPKAYAKDFKKWLLKNGITDEMGKRHPVKYEDIFIDPSAKGFILQLYEEGIEGIKQADNSVLRGITLTSSIIGNDTLRVLSKCRNVIAEFGAYRWDPKAQAKGEDKPIKEFDHTMDALRYIINGTRTIWQRLIVSDDKAA